MIAAFSASVGSSVAGVVQLGKLTKIQNAINLLNEQNKKEASLLNIQQQEQQTINNMLVSLAVQFRQAENLISQKEKGTNLTIGIFSFSAISMAIGLRMIVKKSMHKI